MNFEVGLNTFLSLQVHDGPTQCNWRSLTKQGENTHASEEVKPRELPFLQSFRAFCIECQQIQRLNSTALLNSFCWQAKRSQHTPGILSGTAGYR
ncbi:hypothetical protein BaRGS_00007451 [Batillaria attramentaria]|uniref:Uncharacterized protein n=1 Tax=Batillaria attramentaria TaxID=370345 RepID=A0ABD0LPC9_9CAEN